MSEEQEPVSKELWYQQNAMIKDTIKEIKADLKETKADIKSISESVEKILIQTTATNGRVNKLESDTSEVKNYSTDKARLWGGVGVLLVAGRPVITFSIMAINSKPKDGIREALAGYNIEVK